MGCLQHLDPLELVYTAANWLSRRAGGSLRPAAAGGHVRGGVATTL